MHSSEPQVLIIDAEGEGEITAGDIQVPAEVEILNPELVICTLEEGGKVYMEITAGPAGIYFAERNKIPNQPIGVIPWIPSLPRLKSKLFCGGYKGRPDNRL